MVRRMLDKSLREKPSQVQIDSNGRYASDITCNGNQYLPLFSSQLTSSAGRFNSKDNVTYREEDIST